MGKTFLALFSAFKPDELCQFYLYPAIPDTQQCGGYYRFTDRDALRSIVDRHCVGRRIEPDFHRHDRFACEREARFYQAPHHRTEWMRLGRDLIWRLSNWNNTALNMWLDQQSPDLIFVAPGNQALLYDMARTIAAQRDIPLIVYICDDFYFSMGQCGFVQKYRRNQLRGKIENLLKNADAIVTISQELAERYRKTFGIKAETIMTCPTCTIRPYRGAVHGARSGCMVYMGNIGLGRAESLLALGQALWTENQTEATDFTLEIYTGDSSPALLDRLSACPAIRLHGFVSGSDYEKAFESADVFVHVESFEKENRERVRYSVSTKIISCLASGKPLLAYGPEEVASMSYLRRNQCAILAQSPAELPAAIKTVLTQEERRKEIAENARKTAEREAGNSLRLHRILEDSLKKRT